MIVTGKQLKAARRKQGINQADFGRAVGISRHSVSYWENKSEINIGSTTPRKMCEALGLPANGRSNARARGWGLIDHQQLALDARSKKNLAETKTRTAAHTAKRRVICGAKTRKGYPCRLSSEPGKQRCKFHGGMSTGPRTQEGRAKVAEAQRKRWAAKRRESDSFEPKTDDL